MDSVGSQIVPDQPIKMDEPPLLHVHRYLGGYGQEGGRLVLNLENPSDEERRTVVFEALPWFVRLYMHTLEIRNGPNLQRGGLNGGMRLRNGRLTEATDLLKRLYYRPAKDRERPAVFELLLTIPAKSTIHISISFEKAHLRYTEHPPDANRGFDLSGALVSVYTGPSDEEVERLYSENVLLSLPTPDFSMPYNVITMTCTLFALYFGSLFNLLTRKFIPVLVSVPSSAASQIVDGGGEKPKAE